MQRLTKTEHGCLLAIAASVRSEDPSTKVGIALENYEGRICVVGYNGFMSGQVLDFDPSKDRDQKLDNVIHAETNALSLVKRGEIRVAYLTHSPCAACCSNIKAHGIKKVVYMKKYHGCDKFLSILSKAGVEVERFDASNLLKKIDFSDLIEGLSNG
jgi:dCMP deaminase